MKIETVYLDIFYIDEHGRKVYDFAYGNEHRSSHIPEFPKELQERLVNLVTEALEIEGKRNNLENNESST